MAGKRLTLEERSKIEVLFGQGYSFPEIAAVIGRDRSTVWREVTRNNSYRGMHLPECERVRHPGRSRKNRPGLGGAYRWAYSARRAQEKACRRARRYRPGKLLGDHGAGRADGDRVNQGRLWPEVSEKLGQRWSPRQIAQERRRRFPDEPEQWVSHETIYQAIYYQARGGMRAELARQVALRSGRTRRRPQSRLADATRGKPWVSDFHISTRPAEVEDRAVPGHWEGDLVIGKGNASAIITLVERHSRYVMLGALPHSQVSDEVVDVLTGLMARLPGELTKTLTWDQGSEMARHARFTLASNCRVFFCDPHSPWQRGSNENTNGLLRQYFPKGATDFRTITQDDLDAVARELNGRPRQTLDWANPAETLNKYLVATTT